MKNIIALAAILIGLIMADVSNSPVWQSNECQASTQGGNSGYYQPTSQSVTIYSENGNPKGSFRVYLHDSRRYIYFQNSWICIQGKQRFSHNGNWYVIR